MAPASPAKRWVPSGPSPPPSKPASAAMVRAPGGPPRCAAIDGALNAKKERVPPQAAAAGPWVSGERAYCGGGQSSSPFDRRCDFVQPRPKPKSDAAWHGAGRRHGLGPATPRCSICSSSSRSPHPGRSARRCGSSPGWHRMSATDHRRHLGHASGPTPGVAMRASVAVRTAAMLRV